MTFRVNELGAALEYLFDRYKINKKGIAIPVRIVMALLATKAGDPNLAVQIRNSELWVFPFKPITDANIINNYEYILNKDVTDATIISDCTGENGIIDGTSNPLLKICEQHTYVNFPNVLTYVISDLTAGSHLVTIRQFDRLFSLPSTELNRSQ